MVTGVGLNFLRTVNRVFSSFMVTGMLLMVRVALVVVVVLVVVLVLVVHMVPVFGVHFAQGVAVTNYAAVVMPVEVVWIRHALLCYIEDYKFFLESIQKKVSMATRPCKIDADYIRLVEWDYKAHQPDPAHWRKVSEDDPAYVDVVVLNSTVRENRFWNDSDVAVITNHRGLMVINISGRVFKHVDVAVSRLRATACATLLLNMTFLEDHPIWTQEEAEGAVVGVGSTGELEVVRAVYSDEDLGDGVELSAWKGRDLLEAEYFKHMQKVLNTTTDSKKYIAIPFLRQTIEGGLRDVVHHVFTLRFDAPYNVMPTAEMWLATMLARYCGRYRNVRDSVGHWLSGSLVYGQIEDIRNRVTNPSMVNYVCKYPTEAETFPALKEIQTRMNYILSGARKVSRRASRAAPQPNTSGEADVWFERALQYHGRIEDFVSKLSPYKGNTEHFHPDILPHLLQVGESVVFAHRNGMKLDNEEYSVQVQAHECSECITLESENGKQVVFNHYIAKDGMAVPAQPPMYKDELTQATGQLSVANGKVTLVSAGGERPVVNRAAIKPLDTCPPQQHGCLFPPNKEGFFDGKGARMDLFFLAAKPGLHIVAVELEGGMYTRCLTLRLTHVDASRHKATGVGVALTPRLLPMSDEDSRCILGDETYHIRRRDDNAVDISTDKGAWKATYVHVLVTGATRHLQSATFPLNKSGIATAKCYARRGSLSKYTDFQFMRAVTSDLGLGMEAWSKVKLKDGQLFEDTYKEWPETEELVDVEFVRQRTRAERDAEGWANAQFVG